MPNQLSADAVTVGDIKVLNGGQVEKVLVGSIARTDTSAKGLGVIPASATITGITVYGATQSNASSTATISLGKAGGTGTEYLSTFDVKGATGAQQANPAAAALGAVGTSNVTVNGIYAESGTASSTGGPWQVAIRFVTSTS